MLKPAVLIGARFLVPGCLSWDFESMRFPFAEVFIQDLLPKSYLKSQHFQLPYGFRSTGEGCISYILIEITEKTNIKTMSFKNLG